MEEVANTLFVDLIEEYCQEGYLYLYDDKPLEMERLDNYIKQQELYVDVIHRGTDYYLWLNVEVGDIVNIKRVQSWTRDINIAEVIYEGVDHVILTIKDEIVTCLDISNISYFKEEMEILLSSNKFKVIDKQDNKLVVTTKI